jgi:hypothetical protein
MKDLLTDASTFPSRLEVEVDVTLVFPIDFPRTVDQRVYHLGLRRGEIANRVVRRSLL